MSPGIFHPINYDMSHIGSILEKILYLWETLKTNRSKGLDPMLAVEHGSRISLPSYSKIIGEKNSRTRLLEKSFHDLLNKIISNLYY